MRIVMCGLLVLVGCVAKAPSPEEVRATGDKVSAALAARLTGALQQKMAGEGPVAAIGFCNLEALPLTAEVARAHPEVKVVRRVGVRTRNPANAGDEMDRAALAKLAEGWKAGAVPSPVVMSDGSSRARYYRPLPTAGTCLICHGPAESIAPPVAEVLRKLYPKDEATGFKAGDLRGAIVVEF